MKKYPKIGIRPVIDGRQGGVRESLEEKTMALANAVAELISSNLKNGDGSPVECVIADGTIGAWAKVPPARRNLKERVSVPPSPSPPAGATVPKPWTCTPTTQKQCGALTVRSDREPSTWRPCWPRTPRKDCPPLASTGVKCKTWTTTVSRKRWQRNCFASHAPRKPWPPCAENRTSPSAASRWVSRAPWSIPICFKNTSV